MIPARLTQGAVRAVLPHPRVAALRLPREYAAGNFQSLTPAPIFSLGSLHPLDEFLAYGREGVWHIWIGYDRCRSFIARATRASRRLVLGLGSSLIALLGFLWFVERGFNLEILES